MAAEERDSVLVVEAFYGGSHKQLLDTLAPLLDGLGRVDLVTLPGSKWHWRARAGVLSLFPLLPTRDRLAKVKLLLASSVVDLATLVGLRPELGGARKLLYVHETQLIYPRQAPKDWDIQFGLNEVTAALAADRVLFNSHFAKDSFLDKLGPFLKRIPDFRPAEVKAELAAKAGVLHFPLRLDLLPAPPPSRAPGPLRIVWPHRWEHDKGPEAFFAALDALASAGAAFEVTVLGQSFQQVPDAFHQARQRLGDRVTHWGPAQDKDHYHRLMASCDVAVSTAAQETFGVAMLEAAALGCLVLCPHRLVYPEIFPPTCLYSTEGQLVKALRALAARPGLARERWAADVRDVPAAYDWPRLEPQWQEALRLT